MKDSDRRPRLPSPALVVACLALGIALGGTGMAAVTALPRNSVGTAQLRDGAVQGRKIMNESITGLDVRNGSLLKADFKAGELPAGPQGPAGAAGAQGPAGPRGPSGVLSGTTVTGGGPNPSGTTHFFGVPVQVSVPSPKTRVLVVASNAFGTSVSQAGALNLFICYQQPGGAVTPVGNGILGLQLPPGSKVPMGLSKVITLPVGDYAVGMCGTGGANWNNNDWGTTTALLFETP